MRVKKSDQRLLTALRSVPNVADRNVIVRSLCQSSLDVCKRHVKLLLQGKRRGYRLEVGEERDALRKSLRPHKRRLRDLVENRSQRGGWLNSLLISSLVPLVAQLLEEQQQQHE